MVKQQTGIEKSPTQNTITNGQTTNRNWKISNAKYYY